MHQGASPDKRRSWSYAESTLQWPPLHRFLRYARRPKTDRPMKLQGLYEP